MTRIDLHPEDLLNRAMRGSATPTDLTQLERHLAECAVCRVERSLLLRAAFDAAPLRNEKQLLARLERGVGARLGSPMARRARRKSALVAAVLVAVCVAGAAAAATLAIGRRVRGVETLERGRAGAAAPVLSTVRHFDPRPAGVSADHALSSGPPPSDAPPSEPTARELLPGEGLRDSGRPAAPAGAVPSSASELFSRANQARRDGKVSEAVRLYRALQDRCAGSGEELVSRVSLGRLLLDRLGDSRGALVQFNSYLASPAGGALREEAMVGRALAR
jgi:hypothetical protein